MDRDVSQDVIEISKENTIGDEGNPEDPEEGYEEIPSNVDLECEVTAKDANSAISRAKSPFCKKEIHRLYCLNKGKSGTLGRLKSGPSLSIFLILTLPRRSPKIIIRHIRINTNH